MATINYKGQPEILFKKILVIRTIMKYKKLRELKHPETSSHNLVCL